MFLHQVRAESVEGYWEGSITLPATSLQIQVDLQPESGGTWAGTINIPVQNLRDFKLGSIEVGEDTVEFRMPGIPGDPRFSGKLAANPASIAGRFFQGGQSHPFKLVPKPKPVSARGRTPDKGVPGTVLTGTWQGTLSVGAAGSLRLLLELTNGTVSPMGGVLTSLDQGNARFAFPATTNTSGGLSLAIPSIKASFQGRLNEDGSELYGTWVQGAGKLPLVFKRLAAAPNLRRPQDPTKPYPYAEMEVTIPNRAAGIALAGTLTLPPSRGPHPAVLLLTGSGPQDRDESIQGHRPFLVLADYLTRAGIAVLRCDDRGVGRSTGQFATATHADFVSDAQAQLAWLRAQPQIAPGSIGLIGHSEGAVVAPLVAVERPGQVRFLALLAGPGVPMDELLVRQGRDLGRASGVDPNQWEANEALQRELFRLLTNVPPRVDVSIQVRELLLKQARGYSEQQRTELGLDPAALASQAKTIGSPWFRELLRYNPAVTLQKIRIPVLALNGGRDLQVASAENLRGIKEALEKGGNRRVETLEFPELNHLFQRCTTGAPSEYGGIDETMNPAVLEKLTEWIHQQTQQ